MTNENKNTTRRASTRKPSANKKAEKKVEDKEVIEEKVLEKTPTKPTRAKRIEIDKNELIACRSTVSGRLIYRTRENEKIVWSDYGTERFLEMGELIRMNGEFSGFLKDILLVVDDEEAAEYLGLNKLYEELFELDNLDSLFNKPNKDLEELLPKLPNGQKKTLASHARKLVEEGTLDSLSKMRLIEQALGVDLQMFIPKA